MRTFQFVNLRLWSGVVAVLVATWVGSASVAADVAPYEAQIMTPGAPILSGPGERFYPTDTLAQGDVVEVYREESGGWLGIRPPEDSFSWIFGRHVTLVDGGLAEIDKDDVQSRIGSRLGDKRSAVQIQLTKGEVVEIIGKEIVDGEAWYKIAPPSGEFRWIHTRHVARETPPAQIDVTQAADAVEPSPPPIVIVPVAGDDATRGDANVALAADAQALPEPNENASQNWRASPVATAEAAAAPAQPAASVPQTPSVPPTTGAPVGAAPQSPQPSRPPAEDGLARQLTDIELRLSRMVAEPPNSWQIAPLRQEAQQLLAQVRSEPGRAAVNSTIGKLDRFAAIAARYPQVATSAAQVGQPPITPVDAATGVIGGNGQRYDAIGFLRPVVSKRPGAPQFALVDERGQVVSFVTPTPDMNLQPYLGHRIGITGSRGFIPEFQRAHVTAGRVAPLAERVLR